MRHPSPLTGPTSCVYEADGQALFDEAMGSNQVGRLDEPLATVIDRSVVAIAAEHLRFPVARGRDGHTPLCSSQASVGYTRQVCEWVCACKGVCEC